MLYTETSLLLSIGETLLGFQVYSYQGKRDTVGEVIMQIRWKKSDGQGRPDVLTCIRKDGSITYTRLSPFFPLHDLMHYAVESTLGYKNAFFGLIAQGWAIGDFEEKDQNTGKIARQIPYEADISENLVGLLQLAEFGSLSGGPQEISELLAQYCTHHKYNMPIDIDKTTVGIIQKCFAELHRRWSELAPGGSLILYFPG